MRILVTGATGYIGSHAVVSLIEAGHEVVAVDNFSNSAEEVLAQLEKLTGRQIHFYEMDLKDREATFALFEENKIEGVMHFAAYKSVTESINEPVRYYVNNLYSTLHLIEACEAYKVNRFVFSSSATVYGNLTPSPVHENASYATNNPYGQTKVIGEQILMDYASSRDHFKVTLLRYFNPIGAHPSGLIGENPKAEPNNIMPCLLKAARYPEYDLKIFGSDYDTEDGSGIRDFIHVMDLVEGHIAAIENMKESVNIYNLGTGRGTTVLNLIHTFNRVNDVVIPYEIVGRRQGDIAISYADSSKIADEIGWQSKRSLEDMCRDSWHYYKAMTD